jgi:beta-galactosidase
VAHDNGNPTSHESFRGNTRKAFHGLALCIIQSKKEKGKINIEVISQGLTTGSVTVITK